MYRFEHCTYKYCTTQWYRKNVNDWTSNKIFILSEKEPGQSSISTNNSQNNVNSVIINKLINFILTHTHTYMYKKYNKFK